MSGPEPDYTKCSLEELRDVQRVMDAEKHPERARMVDLLIRDREQSLQRAREDKVQSEEAEGGSSLATSFTVVIAMIGLLGIVLFAGLGVWGLKAQSDYTATAEPYLKEVIPQIATWQSDVALSHMDDDIRRSMNRSDFDAVMVELSQLGNLQWLGNPQFLRVEAKASTSTGPKKLVYYEIPATFDNGKATIRVTLIDRSGDLRIYGFYFNSKVLL